MTHISLYSVKSPTAKHIFPNMRSSKIAWNIYQNMTSEIARDILSNMRRRGPNCDFTLRAGIILARGVKNLILGGGRKNLKHVELNLFNYEPAC